jgi:hypothetical protein
MGQKAGTYSVGQAPFGTKALPVNTGNAKEGGGAAQPGVRNNLGRLLISVGRPREAVPLLNSAHAILAGRLTSGHPHLDKVRTNLRKAMEALASSRLRGRKAKRLNFNLRKVKN